MGKAKDFTDSTPKTKPPASRGPPHNSDDIVGAPIKVTFGSSIAANFAFSSTPPPNPSPTHEAHPPPTHNHPTWQESANSAGATGQSSNFACQPPITPTTSTSFHTTTSFDGRTYRFLTRFATCPPKPKSTQEIASPRDQKRKHDGVPSERHPKKPILLSPLSETGPGGPSVEGDVEHEAEGDEEQDDQGPETEPVAEHSYDFIYTVPLSTRTRYLMMDGLRNMLDKQRIQLNTITKGVHVIGRNLPDMPELKVDEEAYRFTSFIEEAIELCLEKDAAETIFRAAASASGEGVGTSQAAPTTTTVAPTTEIPSTPGTAPATTTTATTSAYEPTLPPPGYYFRL